MDDSKISELKAKHKKLTMITTEDGSEFVFRAPSRIEFNVWFAARENSELDAGQMLAQSTLIFPQDFGAVTKVLEDEPALLMRPGGILDSIVELAGLGKEATRGKKL